MMANATLFSIDANLELVQQHMTHTADPYALAGYIWHIHMGDKRIEGIPYLNDGRLFASNDDAIGIVIHNVDRVNVNFTVWCQNMKTNQERFRLLYPQDFKDISKNRNVNLRANH
ncbi:hypothetical protein Ga0100230_007195 [Opitutaceae bacterium TAV3]|nr:hypothetical protein Ga0100230_007055 [Opitutaceae bacterium TAV3]RRK01619.1 hypothetical protein Ga0100230_007195 [Opitutaceae bacterium TAV3]